MAAKNTTAAPATDLDALIDRMFAGEQMPETDSVGFGTKVAAFFGDRVADSGDPLAEITQGFKAAGLNYQVAKEAALERQKQRTKARIEAYLASKA